MISTRWRKETPAMKHRQPAQCKRSSRGFQLLELLIALTILAVGILALFGTIVPSIRSVSKAKDVYYGTEIAKQRIEYVRSRPFNYQLSAQELSNDINIAPEIPEGREQSYRDAETSFHYDILIYAYRNGTLLGDQTNLDRATNKVVVVTVMDRDCPAGNQSQTSIIPNYVKLGTSICRTE